MMRAGRLGSKFWTLWTASTASCVGDGMLAVALPLLATRLTSDARLISGVAVAETLPWLLAAIPAGAIADRLPYRRLLVSVDLARAALLGGIGVLAVTGHLTIWLLLAGTFAVSLLRPLFDAAAHRVVPTVVAEDHLDEANGYLEASVSAGDEVAGRAVGGILSSIAFSIPILADAISFLISAVVLRNLPEGAPAVNADTPIRSLRSEIAEGLRWFASNRPIRTLSLMIAGLALAQSMVFAVLVLIAKQRYTLPDRSFGFFMAVIAAGGIGGGLGASRIVSWFGHTRTITIAMVIVAVGYIVTWSTDAIAVAGLALSVGVAATSAANVAVVTLRQRLIPRAMIGRVSNVIRTLTWGALPIGSALGGALVYRYEARTPLLIAGMLSGGIALLASLTARRWTPTTAGAEQPSTSMSDVHA